MLIGMRRVYIYPIKELIGKLIQNVEVLPYVYLGPRLELCRCFAGLFISIPGPEFSKIGT